MTSSALAVTQTQYYIQEMPLPRKEDPLRWWKMRQHVYPELSNVALKYVCVLGTSVPSERVFSKMGEILTERRTRLKAKYVKQLIFINGNSDLIK
jgi:hypothetical protein